VASAAITPARIRRSHSGRKFCTEIIQEIRTIKGVHGVHLMAYRQEESVAEIIERSGVLAGRVPWHPERDSQTNSDRKAS